MDAKGMLSVFGISVVESKSLPSDMAIITNGRVTSLRLVEVLEAVAAERQRCIGILRDCIAREGAMSFEGWSSRVRLLNDLIAEIESPAAKEEERDD